MKGYEDTEYLGIITDQHLKLNIHVMSINKKLEKLHSNLKY